MSKYDDGLAFPREAMIHTNPVNGEKFIHPGSPGMSLLDYYVGQLLPTVWNCVSQSGCELESVTQTVAEACYQIASAAIEVGKLYKAEKC
jgi:hypothetical protein